MQTKFKTRVKVDWISADLERSIPNLGGKLLLLYKLLRKIFGHFLTQEHDENLEILKTDLQKATNLTLRLARSGLQYVLICDNSYYGSGFVLMIEDSYLDKKNKLVSSSCFRHKTSY